LSTNESAPPAAGSRRIRLYSAPLCYACYQAKSFLETRGLPYQEVDVSKNAHAARELMGKTGARQVPVIEVGGQVVLGFDRSRLARLLDSS